MLSEDALENLILPIVARQEAINNFVIQTIAKRVKEIGHLLPSDVYKLERLYKSGADVKLINKEIARLTNLNEKEIKKIIKEVAKDAYKDAKPFYDYRHKSFIPFEKNEALQKVVKAVQNQTVETYMNLSKAQTFMLRDLKNPKRLIPTPLAKAYHTIIDEAVQANQQGVVDYNTAMRRTLKQLNESGIRNVVYNTESGRTYSQRLDTAVRRNVLDGIRAINQSMQDEIGKQLNTDGKEISVHANSAPDHEPIQGHQFTNEEYEKLQNNEPFEDVDGEKFEAIERPIGVLNCMHYTFSIIIGVEKPNYTKEQLQKFIEHNQKGYTTKSGKHYTMYECTQHQRELETRIRRAKDGQMMAIEAGDMKLVDEYQTKVAKITDEYNQFSKACGLSPKLDRIRVVGYKRVKF